MFYKILKLVFSWVLLFILGVSVIFYFDTDYPDGKCEKPARISFRGLKFSFPISAYHALKSPGKIWHVVDGQIRADSILPGTVATWYFRKEGNEFEPGDSTNFLRHAHIYGVTFLLYNDRYKRDDQILAELKKHYPGGYRLTTGEGGLYYINRQKCLSVIFKRQSYYSEEVPTISFCYGLSDSQLKYYGQGPGKTTYSE